MRTTTLRTTTLIAALLFGYVLCPYPVRALETSIAYQGVLRDSTGNVLVLKTQTIDFRLYTVPTGGTALWGRKITVQLSDVGLFNTELCGTSGSPLGGTTHPNLVDALKSARANTALFVGLTVENSSGEIAPRQKLLMVPYASYAADTDTASGNFTVQGKATLGNTDVVGTMTIEGQTTLTGDTVVNGTLTAAKDITAQATGKFVGYGTLPVGGIIMWSGSAAAIPVGWALCNGQTVNGITTPNFNGRFIMGCKTESSIGATGGSYNTTLTVANLPAHEHYYAGDDALESVDTRCTTKVDVTNRRRYDATSNLDKGESKVYKTSPVGGYQSFDTTPPYYQLAFIMRVM